ncbi:MAG TPA: ribonuclease HI family protein [Candidatus Paceibacterota bacterium]
MQTITIYTDGGARGNPGPAGIGAVIVGADGRIVEEVSKFLGHQTNNYAEYHAVIEALEAVKKLFGATKLKETTVEMYMDSELVVKQLNGIYQVKEPTLFPQFIKIHNLRVKDFPHITFSHVPREKNKKADKLANDAMDRGETNT